MEECLITDEVCPNDNKKCKVCKLDSCKEVLHMIEKEQEREDMYKINSIKEQLPSECKNCSFLIITNLTENKVFCPYRIKERCVINGRNN